MGRANTMTEQQVIERLAGRLGWTYADDPQHKDNDRFGGAARVSTDPEGKRKHSWGNAWTWERGFTHEPEFLESRDALAPVLEGLSEIDWRKLVDVVFDKWAATPTAPSAVRYILTLPPRDLAFAIAEAIEEAQP
jgi:hypothetical protein